MAKSKKSADKPSIRGLAAEVAKSLGKQFKNSDMIITHGVTDDSITNVKNWVSTGCQILDVAISNIPNGGYPCGRLTVLYGEEQSGKTLLALHALAETQKKGGLAIYIDTERALHTDFAKAIGINLADLIHVPHNQLEHLFAIIVEYIAKYRLDKPDQAITIVFDSLAGVVTEEDLAGGWETGGYRTHKAIQYTNGFTKLMSVISDEDICFIATNQVKYKMNVRNPMYESKWKMGGPQAIPHFASVIIKLDKAGKIKGTYNGFERIVGRTTRATIEKNRMGPPEVQVKFDVLYQSGVDNYGSWEDYIKKFKICPMSGAWYTYDYVDTATGDITTYKGHGWDKFCTEVLREHEHVAQDIYVKLCEAFIMTYKVGVDQMVITKET